MTKALSSPDSHVRGSHGTEDESGHGSGLGHGGGVGQRCSCCAGGVTSGHAGHGAETRRESFSVRTRRATTSSESSAILLSMYAITKRKLTAKTTKTPTPNRAGRTCCCDCCCIAPKSDRTKKLAGHPSWCDRLTRQHPRNEERRGESTDSSLAGKRGTLRTTLMISLMKRI